MATIDLGKIRFNWQGAYNNSTAYVVNDVVSSGGNSYICKLASTGNAVSNGTYWDLMSQAGTNGANGTDLTSTLTTQGDIVVKGASALERLAKGTASQQLRMNSGATGLEYFTPSSAGFTHGTEQATSSGTGVTFSGIPAGVSMIVVAWDDVTLDSASAISVQLGDAGGIETSAYDIIRGYWRASSTTLVGGGSAGFDLLINFSAGYGCAGQMILTLKDPANHTWVYTGMAQASSPSQVMGGAGDKSLSAELTQLKFKPLAGNFTGGSVNIMYQ